MEPVVTFLQENTTAIIVMAAILIPLCYVFRKFTVPFFMHSVELAIYVSVMHVVMSGMIRLFSWFRSETHFRNMDGSLMENFKPMLTPLYDRVWDRAAYNPQWLFYVELVFVAALLYIVVVIRPTRFSRGKNKYKGNPKKDFDKKGYEKGATYDRSRTASTRSR